MLSSEIAFSFSMRFLKPIHIVACVSSSLLTEKCYMMGMLLLLSRFSRI